MWYHHESPIWGYHINIPCRIHLLKVFDLLEFPVLIGGNTDKNCGVYSREAFMTVFVTVVYPEDSFYKTTVNNW